MIRLGVLFAAVGSLVFFWHECGEDLAVFCYRIGLGAVTGLRSNLLVPVPITDSSYSAAARNNAECSTTSSTYSVRFTAPKGFNT
jgi:hypothetical protein